MKKQFLVLLLLICPIFIQAEICLHDDVDRNYFSEELFFTDNEVIFKIMYSEELDDTIQMVYNANNIRRRHNLECLYLGVGEHFSIKIYSEIAETYPPHVEVIVAISMPSLEKGICCPAFIVNATFRATLPWQGLEEGITRVCISGIDILRASISVSPKTRTLMIKIPYLKELMSLNA